MSKLIGQWGINWNTFGEQFNVHNLDQLVHATARPELGGGVIDDFSAVYDDNQTKCEPYLRIIPFCGNIDPSSYVEDGDMLVYMLDKLNTSDLMTTIKQRGWHAEVCYKNEQGAAMKTSVWGDVRVDRPLNSADNSNPNRSEYIMHIYRPEFPGMAPAQVTAMKQQVRRWNQIFNKHRFPRDGDQYTGSHAYIDPADYGSVADIEGIAKKLINRAPDVQPDVPPVTCVQWSYQVLCLALNVPLNRSTLSRLGVYDAYVQHWQGRAGMVDDTLQGLNMLPVVPHSPAQVLEAYLNVYGKGMSLTTLLKMPETKPYLENLLKSQANGQGMSALVGLAESYFQDVAKTGDLTTPFVVPGRAPYRFIMPSTFHNEARSPKAGNAPWFRYIGTLLHNKFVKEQAS